MGTINRKQVGQFALLAGLSFLGQIAQIFVGYASAPTSSQLFSVAAAGVIAPALYIAAIVLSGPSSGPAALEPTTRKNPLDFFEVFNQPVLPAPEVLPEERRLHQAGRAMLLAITVVSAIGI